MRIAILGATSQMAKDLVLSFAANTQHELRLFARRPDAVKEWISCNRLSNLISAGSFEDFGVDEPFDAILNFVGVGNPAQAVAMGASIFDATLTYDEMALNYLSHHPECRYVFLSSGAAYGSNFEQPVDGNSRAAISINHLQPQDWYAVAKLHAECRHRALPHLPIVDVRVFNYFSHTQDMSARFFITDILRAIQSGETLMTSSDNIVRDYIGPDDFFYLVSLILAQPPINEVVDCYTQAPVDKMTLLASMKERFGLRYEVSNAPAGVNATGVKMNYFSNNRRAEVFGYVPSKTSLDSVLDEVFIALAPADPA
ncbi:MAG: NAD(P)-dependent oxidoreductase [Rhodoferax sp.]|uniref:NAD-dependent epimerase/dehydratase family protein n=1 Tax=Rhodoferax sp. TaxID=50421 RepID=UPI0013FF9883|nr:NAD(P)-dependent oxidoreductase [Rhodoferax sp.]NDP39372.1 NAD(P)-dependent oxidoreductase [Rhodoferax sp.]